LCSDINGGALTEVRNRKLLIAIWICWSWVAVFDFREDDS